MLIIHDLTPEEAGKFDFGENRVIFDNEDTAMHWLFWLLVEDAGKVCAS